MAQSVGKKFDRRREISNNSPVTADSAILRLGMK
jgi:hypothetical protein